MSGFGARIPKLSWFSSAAAMGAIVLITVASGGCQAIVSGEVPGFTCRGTALDVCPAHMYCKGAGCVACEAQDVCDGLDNDCNGLVDDGVTSDHDGDGYTFCGVVNSDGTLVNLDCDDDNPDIHPGAEEVCNGVDDDCDGVVDDPDTVCESGQICAPRGGGCIPESQACTPENCAAPNQCDTSTQQCINPTASLPLGTACGSDKECSSGICATGNLLGSTGVPAVCTKACCTSEQCDDGFVCFAPGSGGRYCLAADKVGRAAAAEGVATKAGGTSCQTNGDCRSGACRAGQCLDTCCHDSDCGGGTFCGLVHDGAAAPYFGCRGSAGSGAVNAVCDTPANCGSNLCAYYAGESRCAAPCCNSIADCPNADGTPITCVNARSSLTDNATVSSCVGTTPHNAKKSFGEACTQDDECFSSMCDGSTAKCSTVCCLDRDCPKGSACRPAPIGGLRCVP